MNKNPAKFFVIVFLIAIIFYLSYSLLVSKNEKSKQLNRQKTNIIAMNFIKEKDVLKNKFEKEGGRKTIEFFNNQYIGVPDEVKHILEHYLGEELYLKEGAEGIKLCPDTLFSGCFHGFFAKAMSVEGEEFVKKAESVCGLRKDFFQASGCIHGIGHGFLTFKGYDNLNEALKSCDRVSYSIPFGNEMCYTGVFMEYNLVTVYDKDGEKLMPRPFRKDKAFEPCINVFSSYQSACYLQLPQWWSEVLKSDYAKMGSLCEMVNLKDNRESCFRSIGMVVVRETSKDIDKINAYCKKMPVHEAVIFCLEEASKLMSVLKGANPMAPCRFLKSNEADKCISNVKIFMCEKMHKCD